MMLARVTPPAGFPLTEEEVKLHLRVSANDEMETIQALLRTAVDELDGKSGWLNRALLTQTWRFTLPEVPVSREPLKVSAVMSVPRLGFMDNFRSMMQVLAKTSIRYRIFQGAFWGQCLERAIEETLRDDRPDAILTLDYDTVCTPDDIAALERLLREHPEADAVAALQSARWRPEPLLTMAELPVGVKSHDRMPPGVFAAPLTKIRTAHFGLTLIRASAFAKMPKPWFRSVPDAEGSWGDGRTDDDVYFWRVFEACGLSLYSANRVVAGHLELMVIWPGEDFAAVTQRAADFSESGKPQGIWQ